MIKNPQGFTLMETIIYVALLALLMGGTLLAAYQILQSSSATSAHDSAGMEGSFIMRKVAWALGGAQTILIPSAAYPWSTTLTVMRYDGTTVTIDAATYPGIAFKRVMGPGGIVGIEASTTLSGKSFYYKKYVPN